MKRTLILMLFLYASQSNAQITQSPLKSAPKEASINVLEQVQDEVWMMDIETIPNQAEEHFGDYEEVKKINKRKKLAQQNVSNTSSNKTSGATPIIGESFIGSQLKSFTPSDNAIAISNNGWIVSLINQGFEVYDTDGNAIVSSMSWNSFLNNSPSLNLGKFDPRVLYDPYKDRFVLCILHGPVDTAKSKIIVAVSQTNNPTLGWNIYSLNVKDDFPNVWFDFPSMAVNNHELFINGNLFEPAPNYYYKGTVIYQIDLDNIYSGGPIQYRAWSGFDENKYITLVPAQEGQGNNPPNNKMNFVMMNPSQGNVLHRITITDTMNASGVQIDSATYTIPAYSTCADAYIKDVVTGNLDSLSTGASWVQNAIQLEDKIFYTFAADVNGWCGVHLGTLNLTTGTSSYTSYSQAGTDMAYPAIASLGYSPSDKNMAMVFVRADINTYPEMDVITIDDASVWSARQTVKTGDTMVNILTGQAERWGDYSGIVRKYNATTPEAWAFGSYATNTLPRRASYGNWIAQVISGDNPLQIENVSNSTIQDVKTYPNPAADMFTVDFELHKVSQVSINLFDMNGRVIKNLLDEQLPSSRNKFSFNRKALPNGQYLLEVQVDQERIIKKIILVD